jgi:formylglycine-generating enzyme required for sulfatase activity
LSNQDDISTIRIQIHAIEMVFVPTGGFYVGDGDGATQSTGAFYKVDYTGTGNEIVNTPVFINYLEDAYLTWDNSVVPGKKIVKVSGGFGIEYLSGGSFLKNDKWPDGYGAFYCMKYEISQAQYRDFLNSITRVQQESRARIVDETVKKYAFYTVLDYTPAHRYVGKRNFIRTKISYIPDPTKPIRFGCDYAANRFEGDAVYDSADDGEWTAMNYLTEADFLAYADWAGLRPMTELEWEKACRGHGTPKTGEYAWGSTVLNKGTMMASVLDAGTDEERFSGLNGVDGVSNYGQAFDDNGPMRCGFASRPGTTRAQAGASCWGALDMTGNLSEFVVSILEGTFEGTHGDGTLAADGNSDNTDWSCGTFKDFSWMAFFFMPVSARSDGFLDDQAMGGRLVRTAHDAF